MNNYANQTKKIAFMGLLFALAVVLGYLEGLFPTMPNGIKLGLSNIITMYTLFFLGKSQAYTIAVLKSFFVLLTRGPTAALMSICGGLLSVTAMIIIMSFKKAKPTYLIISVVGAVFHNIGQLIMASIYLKRAIALYYLPIMLVSGIIMGSITGLSLNILLPAIKRITKSKRQ